MWREVVKDNLLPVLNSSSFSAFHALASVLFWTIINKNVSVNTLYSTNIQRPGDLKESFDVSILDGDDFVSMIALSFVH